MGEQKSARNPHRNIRSLNSDYSNPLKMISSRRLLERMIYRNMWTFGTNYLLPSSVLDLYRARSNKNANLWISRAALYYEHLDKFDLEKCFGGTNYKSSYLENAMF